MFLPLNDEAPNHHLFRPFVTWVIIAANIAIFVLFQSGLVFPLADEMAVAYGLIPSVFFGHNTIASDVFHAPAWATPLTYLFLHGGWMHLIGNMIFLWIFGDNVEAAMGPLRYALFYLGAGAAAGIAFAFADPMTDSPLIGASGSVSAVLGAYFILHPHVKVFGLLLNIIPVRIPAYWFISGWFVLQVGHALFDANQGVAWIAHVAGLVAGALAVVAMGLRQPSFATLWRK